MNTKDVIVKVKAGPADGLAEGQFSAYASVFGNVDSYGDVVVKGAFADSLSQWKALDAPIPLLWGHNMADPDYNLGDVKATEDDHGLLVTGTLDADQLADPKSKTAQVYRLLKAGRARQMSFAYDVIDGGPVTKDGQSYYELRKLALHEVSVVPLGANQETEVLAVKSAIDLLADGVKVGRVLAQKHIESLRSAHETIGAVLAAADTSDEGKAVGTTEVKSAAGDEGAEGVKSPAADEGQQSSPSVDSVLAQINLTDIERSWSS